MTEFERIYLRLQDVDFRYTGAIDYDYCDVKADDHYERCANDYCRCSTIEDCVITRFNIVEFIKIIKEKINIDINSNSFDVDIFNSCKELCTNDFNFGVCSGYYGEELKSITLESHVISKLANIFSIKAYRREKIKKIEESFKKDNYIFDEYVKKILIDEYGYVLDSLKNSKFIIIDIKTSDIVFPQKEYNEFVKSSNLSSYKNRKGICGLVKKINNKYFVIDGYHRINANLDKKYIKVILAY